MSLEVDVGDLHVSVDLQHVRLGEGLQPVGEVEQMLAVHKHLVPLVATTNGHLETDSKRTAGSEQPLQHVPSSDITHGTARPAV